MGLVTWDVDPADYRSDSAAIESNVIDNVHPGAIVIMHDGGGDRSATATALKRILPALKTRGYRFATVTEILDDE
jgi:peptidoglycan/xylan/chitin deacetylase (PgdA/CDA1 family)